MSWGAQNRSKDAKTPSAGRAMSEKPELDSWPVQPYSEIEPSYNGITRPLRSLLNANDATPLQLKD
jgi:hypothetical protein